jgi:hypothetical protein
MTVVRRRLHWWHWGLWLSADRGLVEIPSGACDACDRRDCRRDPAADEPFIQQPEG